MSPRCENYRRQQFVPDTALVGQSAAQTGGFRADGGELIRLLEADPLFAAVKSMEF